MHNTEHELTRCLHSTGAAVCEQMHATSIAGQSCHGAEIAAAKILFALETR